jgi:Glycosyl transferase family 2
MAADSTVRNPVGISVIVPARNEEACLETCLRSLIDQRADFTQLQHADFTQLQQPDFTALATLEIIVVDDGSTDRTRAIAESLPNIHVVSPPPLPPGWTGKNNAVIAGARIARGEWLLFTDADTQHRRGSLARALAEAEQHQAVLLSYSPQQEVHGMLEKAVMTVIFAELAATYPPSAVSDPSTPAAAANGQYLLIRRDVYEAIGGHAAVANSLLEDVALAKLVKTSGHRIRFRYAADAVETRMYRSFPQLVEGWTKNLAVLFPSALRLALIRITEFGVLVASAALALTPTPRTPVRLVSLALFTVTACLFWKRIRRAHFSWHASLLAVIGLPIFAYLLLRSRLSYVRGTVTWKGRAYAAPSSAPSRNSSLIRSGNKLSDAAEL